MLIRKQPLDRRVRKTKQKFKEAFLHLIQKKDYQFITITDIVNEADFNRGTFYSHYQQKEDLLNEIVEEMIAGLIRSFREPYHNKKMVNLDTLSPSQITIFDYVLENKEFYQLIFDSNALPNFQEKMIKTFIRLMKEEMTFLMNDANLDINVDLFITYRAYGIFGLVSEWVNHDFHHSTSYMAKQLINIMNFHTPKVLSTYLVN